LRVPELEAPEAAGYPPAGSTSQFSGGSFFIFLYSSLIEKFLLYHKNFYEKLFILPQMWHFRSVNLV